MHLCLGFSKTNHPVNFLHTLFRDVLICGGPRKTRDTVPASVSRGGAADAGIINGMGLGNAPHLELPRMVSMWLGGLAALPLVCTLTLSMTIC